MPTDRHGRRLTALALGLAAACLSCCLSPSPTPIGREEQQPYKAIILGEGDVVGIAFPGAPNLNNAQQVRRDGKITLEHIGDVLALGKSPKELEQEILKLYEPQLVVKEVVVTVESSAFTYYVNGAVRLPSRYLATRPLTVLEAIMEAGGFDEGRARRRAVMVIRRDGERVRQYKLDVKAMLNGKSELRFYLHPFDIVYVPQTWF